MQILSFLASLFDHFVRPLCLESRISANFGSFFKFINNGQFGGELTVILVQYTGNFGTGTVILLIMLKF